MYKTDTTKAQAYCKCQKCGAVAPLGTAICGNPNCRADLGIYGENITPGVQQEPVREEKKALKKQQAEARAQEAVARRSLHNRGPVKAFFLSVLVILVSLIAGILAGGIMMMSFTYWGDLFYYDFGVGYNSYYFPHPLLWHQIIPGVLLIVLSFLFARFALKEKADRKLMYATIGFWTIPFAISCWKRFSHNGGDSYELLSVYLFFLFNLEPILIGSTFAGVKDLKKASSILRWISILMLIATGVMAVILSIDSFFGGIL